MSQTKWSPQLRLTAQKKLSIPDCSMNQTFSEDPQRAIISNESNDDKNICQKYLNLYESIKRKESSDIIQKYQNTMSRVRKSALKTKGIFQNSLIQNSYPKNIVEEIPSKERQSIRDPHVQAKSDANHVHFLRSDTIPSKKNQLTLKLIIEHRLCQDEKQNLPVIQPEMIVKGNQMIQGYQSCVQTPFQPSQNENSLSQRQTPQLPNNSTTQLPPSYWQTNTFIGSNVTKTYTGYYKAKNKKKYEKERQKCLRNSTTFLKNVDRSIENEKYRQLVIRPKTFHQKTREEKKDFELLLQCHDAGRFYEFGNQEKMIRTQSEAKLMSFSRDHSFDGKQSRNVNYFGLVRKAKSKTPHEVGFLFNGKEGVDFERKNHKKYTFNNPSMHQSLKNYSQYPFQQYDPNLLLGVSTEQALKESIFSPPAYEDTSLYDSQGGYLQSKKMIQSKYLRIPNTTNKNSSKVFHGRSGSNHSAMSGKGAARSQQLTLNKIQDTIENDVQLRILKIDHKKGEVMQM